MLDAWQAATERLCSEYRHLPAPQLRARAQELLHGITQLLDQRLTSTQRREVLALAGAALLVGCVEYDGADAHA